MSVRDGKDRLFNLPNDCHSNSVDKHPTILCYFSYRLEEEGIVSALEQEKMEESYDFLLEVSLQSMDVG